MGSEDRKDTKVCSSRTELSPHTRELKLRFYCDTVDPEAEEKSEREGRPCTRDLTWFSQDCSTSGLVSAELDRLQFHTHSYPKATDKANNQAEASVGHVPPSTCSTRARWRCAIHPRAGV